MFAKIIAFLILIAVVYVGSIFIIPDLADTYGNPSLNAQIRTLKGKLNTFAEKDASTKSLIDSAKGIASPYIQETRDTAANIQKTIEQKTEQVKETKASIDNAYQAVDTAKTNIQNLTK